MKIAFTTIQVERNNNFHYNINWTQTHHQNEINNLLRAFISILCKVIMPLHAIEQPLLQIADFSFRLQINDQVLTSQNPLFVVLLTVFIGIIYFFLNPTVGLKSHNKNGNFLGSLNELLLILLKMNKQTEKSKKK